MSFFLRILGRAAGPVDPEGWQVGDWAECIITGKWNLRPFDIPSHGPRHGQIMRVTDVRILRDSIAPGGKVLALAFAGWHRSFFAASEFRKVNPRADEAIAAEAEFTELVRRKPAPAMPRETIREWQ